MMKAVTIIGIMWYLLAANTTFAYTHADTLRGSNGRGRDWWDVKYYSLAVDFDTATKSISGQNTISLLVTKKPVDSMQIDLQEPMVLDSVQLVLNIEDSMVHMPLDLKHESNVWWVLNKFSDWEKGTTKNLLLFYHGRPRVAVNAPWDGGFTWTKDTAGNPWIAVSCQGLGASVWWPCKDAQWDEPDNGMSVSLTVPKGLKAISNGKLLLVSGEEDEPQTYSWAVKNPINNYDVTFYIGDYVHWQDTLMGEKGQLDLDFWVLRYNEARARKQFEIVKPMLHCFEYWMGPYPFYEDGYKLVDAPYLGMEHQSAVAYGNEYKMGYLGHDRTFTGIGMGFDYIIVHESGHEWFGNSITDKDIADMWVHEGFTNYSESLFTEIYYGKQAGQEYVHGTRRAIANDEPIIGTYGVNKEGSGDMYYKSGNMLNAIRTVINDDEKWRGILRGLNKTFYHQTVTTEQVVDYINKESGINLTTIFDQYLRYKNIPTLEFRFENNRVMCRWVADVDGFTMPVKVRAKGGEYIFISPKTRFAAVDLPGVTKDNLEVDTFDYYIGVLID